MKAKNDSGRKKNKRSMAKAITSVVFFTLAAKLLGFLREVTLSFFYGASGISDAYLISQTIPGTIFQFVGVGLSTCFIPIYFKILHSAGKETTVFVNRVLTIVLAFSTGVIFIVWAATPAIVGVFASGFAGDTLYYAVWFTRIGITSLYFSSLIYVFNGYLQANDAFAITAFSAIPNSICIILSIILGAKCNLWILSIGSTMAVGVQLLFLLPAVKKLQFRFKLDFGWNTEYIREFFGLMGPVILGVSVNEINTLVDRTVASQVAVGGISALTYSYSLIMLIQGGFIQPIVTVCYPKITDAVTMEKMGKATEILKRASETILGLAIPATAGLILYSEEIIKMLFGHGVFDRKAVQLTASALAFYAVSICFAGIRELLSRFYYANKDTKTPMINSVVGVFVNIVLNVILSRYMGLRGLAFATSLSAALTAGLLWIHLKKVFKQAFMIRGVELAKICTATLIMAAVSYTVYKLLPWKNPIGLLAAICSGIMSYGLVGYVLKLEIVNMGLDAIKRRRE